MAGESMPAQQTAGMFGMPLHDLRFGVDEATLPVRAEQLRMRMDMYPLMVVGQMGLQLLFVWLYWPHAPHYWLLLWLAVFYAFHALEMYKWRRDKDRLATVAECRDWHEHFGVFALGAGLLWAVGAVVFFPIDIQEQSILISVMLGLVAGAVTMNPVHPPSLFGFVLGVMLPLILQVASANDMHHWLLALMLLMFMLIALYAGYGLSKTFVLSLRQRFEKADLLQQLLMQKAETEAARSQVEETNLELQDALYRLQSANTLLESRVGEQTRMNVEKERLLIQQSRSAAMGEMISNIAHQWRQPLSELGLVVQNIQLDYREEVLSRESLDQYVETAKKCVAQMSGTIDDFRNFFRPDKAKAPFSLSDGVSESLRLLAATLKHNNIQVEFRQDGDLKGYGHPNEFAQVVLNILVNAKEALVAGRSGGRMITIELGRSGAAGTVTIRDNAGGIPIGDLPRLFDPYFTTKPGGTGIGLYMSKTIVEKHMGGSITCRNAEDGAEFAVSIPLAAEGVARAEGLVVRATADDDEREGRAR